MRIRIFLSGIMVMAIGAFGMRILARAHAFDLLQDSLTLGGGFVICGLFSLRNFWHGIIGAGILALLGTARGLGRVPDMARLLAGEAERDGTPALEFGITAVCLVLLIRVLQELLKERTRRLLESREP